MPVCNKGFAGVRDWTKRRLAQLARVFKAMLEEGIITLDATWLKLPENSLGLSFLSASKCWKVGENDNGNVSSMTVMLEVSDYHISCQMTLKSLISISVESCEKLQRPFPTTSFRLQYNKLLCSVICEDGWQLSWQCTLLNMTQNRKFQ